VVVVFTTVDPHTLMVITVVIAVVIAFPGPGDHAAGGHYGETQKNTADYGSFCIVHGVS
jgi:hypothetical protein